MKPLALFAVCLALAAPVRADEQPSDQGAQLAALERSFHYRSGDIPLGDSLATLKLGDRFKFLGPEDADKVLQAWGNPPGGAGLGMLMSADSSPLSSDGWAVLVRYEQDGHVLDEDAASIDYDDVLKGMKEAVEENNEERTKQGYAAIHLTGWAEPPHYDQSAHKLYWAKTLADDGGRQTLNYEIRVLGRQGVLQLSAVSSSSQLAEVKREMPAMLAAVEFNQGSRYTDFVKDSDSLAAYGIGALIAGKGAAKLGLFALLLKGLIASKKLLIALGLGGAALVKRLFGRRTDSTEA